MRFGIKTLVTLALIILGNLSPAFGHSSLVSATPAQDAVLTEFPTEISLTFNESLLEIGDENPNKVEVRNSMGDLLSSKTVVKESTITAPLQITGNDKYEVSYRVVSQDGHVITGEYSFTVESEIATVAPISEAPKEQAESGSNLLVRGFMVLVFIGAIILLRKAVS